MSMFDIMKMALSRSDQQHNSVNVKIQPEKCARTVAFIDCSEHKLDKSIRVYLYGKQRD